MPHIESNFLICQNIKILFFFFGRLSGVHRHDRHLPEAHLPELAHKGCDLALQIIGHEGEDGGLDELLQLRDARGQGDGVARSEPEEALHTSHHDLAAQVTCHLQENASSRSNKVSEAAKSLMLRPSHTFI